MEQRHLFTFENLAPGHPYERKTGTGIKWAQGRVTLMQAGAVLGTATHQSASAYHFWLDRHYLRCFPDVTHWWFGSPWTGRVTVDAQAARRDERTLVGWLHWEGQDEPSAWSVEMVSNDLWLFDIPEPQPPMGAHPANIPLVRRLAAHVYGAMQNPALRGQPVVVSSAVSRQELQVMLSGRDLPTRVVVRGLHQGLASWPRRMGLTPPDAAARPGPAAAPAPSHASQEAPVAAPRAPSSSKSS